MLEMLAAAAVAAAATPPNPAAEAEDVQTVEIVARRPVVGDLQKGVVDYRPEFFTPIRPATAMDMVRWLPGFSFEDTRDVRGLGGSVGNVLIDGRPPASKTDTLTRVLSRIPAEQVERIDLIVGGAPGLDMGGRQVIANVILKKAADWKGQATLEAYTDRNGNLGPWATLNLSRERDDKVVEASLNAGWQLYNRPGVGTGPWVRTDQTGQVVLRAVGNAVAQGPQVVANGAYEQPWAGGKVKLNGTLIYQDVRFSQTDTVSFPTAQSLAQRNDQLAKRIELGALYERSFGRATLETQLLERDTWVDLDTDIDRPPLMSSFEGAYRAMEHVARTTLRFKPDATLTLEGFGEIAYNTYDSTTARTVAGAPVPLPGGLVDMGEVRGETGAVVSWKPNERWSFGAALKAEAARLDSTGDVKASKDLAYLKPRFSASYAPDEDTQIRLRAEREVGQIDFAQYVAVPLFSTGDVVLGNPDLAPQRDWVLEAEIERRFWTGASASLTLRRHMITDVVDQAPVISGGEILSRVDNIGDARQTDVVLSATAPLKAVGLNGVVLRGGVTMITSRVTDPTTGEARRLSEQAGLTWDFHLAHDLPRWKLNWGVDATYAGGQTFYGPTAFERQGSTVRVNLFVEYRVRPKLSVRADLRNITDAPSPQVVQAFQGRRGASPLLYTDSRRPEVNPFFYVRVRRTIG